MRIHSVRPRRAGTSISSAPRRLRLTQSSASRLAGVPPEKTATVAAPFPSTLIRRGVLFPGTSRRQTLPRLGQDGTAGSSPVIVALARATGIRRFAPAVGVAAPATRPVRGEDVDGAREERQHGALIVGGAPLAAPSDLDENGTVGRHAQRDRGARLLRAGRAAVAQARAGVRDGGRHRQLRGLRGRRGRHGGRFRRGRRQDLGLHEGRQVDRVQRPAARVDGDLLRDGRLGDAIPDGAGERAGAKAPRHPRICARLGELGDRLLLPGNSVRGRVRCERRRGCSCVVGGRHRVCGRCARQRSGARGRRGGDDSRANCHQGTRTLPSPGSCG